MFLVDWTFANLLVGIVLFLLVLIPVFALYKFFSKKSE